MTDKVVRIGGASAFIIDSATATPQLLGEQSLDYLVYDYLAEGSMGMLARFQAADPGGGFAPDFIGVHIGPHLPEILRRGIKVVANAGGLNPKACAQALRRAAAELGLAPRIAVVEGDDLRGRMDDLRAAGHVDMASGAPLPQTALSANAYLGGFPIAHALDRGADIVITGRVVDSALALGPLIHEFGWRADQHDLLAAGTLIGHLIECGCQVTGGTHTDWRDVTDWSNVGFPIAECRADGECVITKPKGTGGLVSVGTVAEQLLYEVGDPRAYIVPDAVCDFSGVTLQPAGPDRVRVAGARGRPPTSTYKVCVVYDDGWRATALQPIIGLDAAAKARRQADALIERTSRMLRGQNLGEWTRTHVEVLGAEASYGPRARAEGVREVICRIVADHPDPRGAALLARENHAATTAMSVGTSIGLATTVTPIPHLVSFLLPKDQVRATVTLDGDVRDVVVEVGGGFDPKTLPAPLEPPPPPFAGERSSLPLVALAWGRSGDKGDLFNVGVIARRPDYLPYIRAALTPEAVAGWFAHCFADPARRVVDLYEAPGFHALNFVVREALGGGITSSPRLDPVAKGMAQQLLEFPIPVPGALAAAALSRGSAARTHVDAQVGAFA